MPCEQKINKDDSDKVKGYKRQLNQTCQDIAKRDEGIKRQQKLVSKAKKGLVSCKKRQSKNTEVTCGLYEGNKINEEKKLDQLKKLRKKKEDRASRIKNNIKKSKLKF
tara:strand:+ start:5 stop:328 length:324 start_codon:yes stop_codon:yes gene_type:complete